MFLRRAKTQLIHIKFRPWELGRMGEEGIGGGGGGRGERDKREKGN